MKYHGKLREGLIVIHEEKIKYIKSLEKNDSILTIKFDDGTHTTDENQIKLLGFNEIKNNS